MLYLLYGKDDYARAEYVRQLISRTGLARVDFSGDNPPKGIDDLLSQDLFSGGQAFVLDGLATKFLADEATRQLLAASQNHCIFVEADLDKRTKLTKDLLADTQVQAKEFAVPTPDQLPDWVVKYVKDKNGVIETNAVRALLQRLGYVDPAGGLALALREPSLLRLSQELQKLLMYAGGVSITPRMVEELVSDDRQVISLSISDSLGKKNRKELYGLLEGYYTDGSGEDETSKTLALVGLLADQFRSQLLVKDAVDRRVPEPEILAQTGWKSGRLFVVKRLAQSFTSQQLRDALSKLENLDIELKSTTTPPRVVLELILAQMV